MLNITGMNRSYYIRNFTDMLCNYSRILAEIRHQLGREPQKDEVFIVMSKNRRLVRLFSFDRISFSLYEKRLAPEYQFMKVVRYGDELTYKIDWKEKSSITDVCRSLKRLLELLMTTAAPCLTRR